MQDWFIIFMYNLLTNMDNAIMIQLSLHKYSLRLIFKFYLFVLLCFLRIFYIACIQAWSNVPYINVVTALIMFFFSIRMILPKKNMRRYFTFLWIFSSIAVLDLVMSIDSILLTARLSDNLILIALSVLPALCLIFLFSSKMEEFIAKMPWIEVVIAGLLAQLAILQLKKEPGILQLLHEEWFDLAAITAMCVICILGWFNLWKKSY